MKQKEIIELTVIGDYNDGDYVTEVTTLTKKQCEKFTPLLQAIALNNKPGFVHNWNNSNYKRDNELSPEEMYKPIKSDIIEEFNDNHVPSCEDGIHSIRGLKVRKLIVLDEYVFL